MELRHLRAFIAVADEGNITAAARGLNLTQPALSRQIKALEDAVELELLERGAHSVRLTAAGQMLAKEARDLLQRADAMLDKVRRAHAGESLRVGYSPSLASGLLGVAMERFTQLHPAARVTLSDLTTTEMLSGLCDDKLDVVITVPPDSEACDVEWIKLRSPDWKVGMSARHELAARKSLKPADLQGQKLLIYSREAYPDDWQRISRWLRDQKVTVKSGGEFDGVTSLEAAVEAGLGIALVAEHSFAGSISEGRTVMRDLKPVPGVICVAAGLPKTRDSSKAARVFVEELRRAAK
jgi:DNA-binding transcriptional LysR family regulator